MLKLNYVDVRKVVVGFIQQYQQNTPKKHKIIDMFLFYILLTGVAQFLYCALVGNFPFNCFLSGFISSVALFCLTVSIRMQLVNPQDFHGISRQRAYVDFLICNIILHFVVVTFMG